MIKINTILKDQRELKQVAKNKAISDKIKFHWNTVFGKLSTDLTFDYLRNGCLYISSNNPLWVTEIGYYKEDILKKIKTITKGNQVRYLKIIFRKAEKIKKENKKLDTSSKNINELIKEENERKLKQGYRWCEQCSDVLTKEVVCVFCRSGKTKG